MSVDLPTQSSGVTITDTYTQDGIQDTFDQVLPHVQSVSDIAGGGDNTIERGVPRYHIDSDCWTRETSERRPSYPLFGEFELPLRNTQCPFCGSNWFRWYNIPREIRELEEFEGVGPVLQERWELCCIRCRYRRGHSEPTDFAGDCRDVDGWCYNQASDPGPSRLRASAPEDDGSIPGEVEPVSGMDSRPPTPDYTQSIRAGLEDLEVVWDEYVRGIEANPLAATLPLWGTYDGEDHIPEPHQPSVQDLFS